MDNSGSGSSAKLITHDIPQVIVKKRLKRIVISGNSRMPDPQGFYENLEYKITQLYYTFEKTLIIEFQLEYINTGSSKWLYHILKKLQNLTKYEGFIEINWKYEEDDEIIQEAGEVMQSMLNFPFNFKAI